MIAFENISRAIVEAHGSMLGLAPRLMSRFGLMGNYRLCSRPMSRLGWGKVKVNMGLNSSGNDVRVDVRAEVIMGVAFKVIEGSKSSWMRVSQDEIRLKWLQILPILGL
ncbi:hypothetical protein RIF29_34905 [Crotalaria pallida]|uniref:Uncharacterized protein n=1 Tax=Crotalaria pallida TaxID=3830 RepID=A0AAN9HRG2_CROPI